MSDITVNITVRGVPVGRMHELRPIIDAYTEETNEIGYYYLTGILHIGELFVYLWSET